MICWKDIWEEEPPRNKEILFRTGDDEFHTGEIFSEEKLRKCDFFCFRCNATYSCDMKTELHERVTHWFPMPELKEDEK